MLFSFSSSNTFHGSIFPIISSNRVVNKLHINLAGFENSQVCLLIQNEIPARLFSDCYVGIDQYTSFLFLSSIQPSEDKDFFCGKNLF